MWREKDESNDECEKQKHILNLRAEENKKIGYT